MADADLVLVEGGVKGTGPVGAITALASSAGRRIHHPDVSGGHRNHLAVIISNPACVVRE